jgi:hypothetical protein
MVERDGDFVVDRARFDPIDGRSTTEQITVRGQRVRRFSFSVRIFVAAELRDWLRAVGFRRVPFSDREGEPLTATSQRMITVAQR